MAVGYMDEAGFTLSLPPTYTWVRRGESKGVPRVRGKGGRLNVLGHLVWDGEGWRLGYALCRGKVGGAEVRAYLDRVVEGMEKPLRLFWDHASFHRGREVRGRVRYWEGKGLRLGYLPRYSPHWNPMETVWRRVKGFLLPRRHYRDLDELEQAVRSALEALGGVEVSFQWEGTYLEVERKEGRWAERRLKMAAAGLTKGFAEVREVLEGGLAELQAPHTDVCR